MGSAVPPAPLDAAETQEEKDAFMTLASKCMKLIETMVQKTVNGMISAAASSAWKAPRACKRYSCCSRCSPL